MRTRSAAIYASKFLYTSALGVVFVFLEDVQTKNSLADWEIAEPESALRLSS